MIPLKDNNPTRRPPFVNIVLILLNIAAFIYEVSLGRDLEGFLNRKNRMSAQLILHVTRAQELKDTSHAKNGNE